MDYSLQNNSNPLKISLLNNTHFISNISMYFDDSVTTINDAVKYFGITIDYKLNFDEHINALATKVSRSLEVLCKLRYNLPKSTL